jgi:hypothetical protein
MKHHSESTKVKMESLDTLPNNTSAWLGKEKLNGSTDPYVIRFKTQLHLKEKHIPLSDYISQGQKIIILRSTVNGIMELCQVKNIADRMVDTSEIQISNIAYTS